MSSLTVTINKNLLGRISAETAHRVGEVVHRNVFELEAENKRQIVAVDAIDSGNMLNTQQGVITGPMSGEVHSPAPYSAYSNYGTRHQAGKHWADQAAAVVRPKMMQEIADVVGRP